MFDINNLIGLLVVRMLKLMEVLEVVGFRVELLLVLMTHRFPVVGQHLGNGGSIVTETIKQT